MFLMKKIASSDGFVKAGHLLVLLSIVMASIGAIAGVFSREIRSNIKKYRISSIDEWQIHAASFCLIIFTFPFALIVVSLFE